MSIGYSWCTVFFKHIENSLSASFECQVFIVRVQHVLISLIQLSRSIYLRNPISNSSAGSSSCRLPPPLLSLLNKVRKQSGEKMFVTWLSWWRSCSLTRITCICICGYVFVWVCKYGKSVLVGS